MTKHLDRSAALYIHQSGDIADGLRRAVARPGRPGTFRASVHSGGPTPSQRCSRDLIGRLDERERFQLSRPDVAGSRPRAQTVDPMLLDRLDALLDVVPGRDAQGSSGGDKSLRWTPSVRHHELIALGEPDAARDPSTSTSVSGNGSTARRVA